MIAVSHEMRACIKVPQTLEIRANQRKLRFSHTHTHAHIQTQDNGIAIVPSRIVCMLVCIGLFGNVRLLCSPSEVIVFKFVDINNAHRHTHAFHTHNIWKWVESKNKHTMPQQTGRNGRAVGNDCKIIIRLIGENVDGNAMILNGNGS